MKWLKNFLLLTIPSLFILFLLLELFFRWVIPAADVPRAYFDEQEGMYYFDTTVKDGLYTLGKFAEVRGRWHINNRSWNSAVDYDETGEKPLIAVIGDSYIEALQVDTGESYPDLLRKQLPPGYSVYAFGKSGAPLSQYLHMSRYVRKYFKPRIIIVNIIYNDFAESIRSHYPEYSYFLQLDTLSKDSLYEIPPRTRGDFLQYHPWKKLIYRSALFRYCFFNLHISEMWRNWKGNRDKKFEGNIDVDEVESIKPEVHRATDYILGRLRAENPDSKFLFVMDGTRDGIYNNNGSGSKVAWMYTMMRELTGKYGFHFLDLTGPMKEDYQKHHRAFNAPIDRHWNEYGHALVAREVVTYLRDSGFLAIH